MQALLQRQLRRLQELDPFNDPQKPPELRWESYLATANDVAPKASLPNCTRCYGCNTRLTHMDTASSFFNRWVGESIAVCVCGVVKVVAIPYLLAPAPSPAQDLHQ
jgi:hypothetical protein